MFVEGAQGHVERVHELGGAPPLHRCEPLAAEDLQGHCFAALAGGDVLHQLAEEVARLGHRVVPDGGGAGECRDGDLTRLLEHRGHRLGGLGQARDKLGEGVVERRFGARSPSTAPLEGEFAVAQRLVLIDVVVAHGRGGSGISRRAGKPKRLARPA